MSDYEEFLTDNEIEERQYINDWREEEEWNDNEMWESAIQAAERLDEDDFNHGDLYESIDIEGKH